MKAVRSKDTKPELVVRRFLHQQGFRYRLHVRKLPGNPDLVLPKYNTAVFVNGCFWHGHKGCKRAKMPKTNRDYWLPKITRNLERDVTNYDALTNLGLKVIVVWECELSSKKNKTERLQRLIEEIRIGTS